MAKHAVMFKLLHDADHDDQMARQGPDEKDEDRARILTNPNAEVDGRTITEWSEVWLKKLINTPAGTPNGTDDPNGTVAAAINHPHSKMYFITAVNPHVPGNRTFNVHHGQDVYVPIIGIADSEGKDIDPTIGPNFGGPGSRFADEVRMVLDDAKFDQPTVTINGKSVANLKEFNTGIFSAGFAKPGTAAIPFFFVNNPQGTQLKTTGEEGYAMVLKNLPVGKYRSTLWPRPPAPILVRATCTTRT